MRTSIVDEINRYAKLSFAEVLAERKQRRQHKLNQLKQWSAEMQKKYNGIK